MNVGATFQRATYIAFLEEKNKYVVIYLDDITIFSKIDPNHLQHLRKVFLKCRKFGISLNPKKSHFAMEEGKLLGHVISKRGIKIYLDRVAAIQQIGLPRNKKEWRNKAMCGFHKSKPGISQGQLPPSKNGSYLTKGSWVSKDVYAEWFLRLQLGCSPPRGPRKDNLYHSMGHLHVCQNDLWIDECWSHFLEGNGHRILRGEGQVCYHLSG